MPRTIDLEERQQFRVLLNPVRQEIVRLLPLAGRPLSASTVARRLKLSPLAAKGHLEKLAGLGLVEVIQPGSGASDHMGTLYGPADVEIRIHLGRKDAFQGEREELVAENVDGIFRSILDVTRRYPEEELADRISLQEVLATLPPQDRQLIFLRFFSGKTQSETAKVLGTTQVQISRRERKILQNLRGQLLQE